MPVKIFLLLGLGILTACSLDYGEALAESLDDTPSLILYGVTNRLVEDGQVVYTLVAKTAEEYAEKKESRITEGNFKEFGQNGQVRTEGSVGFASLNQDTKDAEMGKTITLYSQTEDTRLTAAQLSWSDSRKRLTSSPQETVKVERKSNSTIEGTGFSMDMKTKTMEFSGSVQGTYVVKESPSP